MSTSSIIRSPAGSPSQALRTIASSPKDGEVQAERPLTSTPREESKFDVEPSRPSSSDKIRAEVAAFLDEIDLESPLGDLGRSLRDIDDILSMSQPSILYKGGTFELTSEEIIAFNQKYADIAKNAFSSSSLSTTLYGTNV